MLQHSDIAYGIAHSRYAYIIVPILLNESRRTTNELLSQALKTKQKMVMKKRQTRRKKKKERRKNMTIRPLSVGQWESMSWCISWLSPKKCDNAHDSQTGYRERERKTMRRNTIRKKSWCKRHQKQVAKKRFSGARESNVFKTLAGWLSERSSRQVVAVRHELRFKPRSPQRGDKSTTLNRRSVDKGVSVVAAAVSQCTKLLHNSSLIQQQSVTTSSKERVRKHVPVTST